MKPSEIEALVRALKMKYNISQKDLAKKLGYNESYLSAVIGGSSKASEKFIRTLRSEYSKDVDELANESLRARVTQLQALLGAMEFELVKLLARGEKKEEQEIRDRLTSRTISNLSKLIA